MGVASLPWKTSLDTNYKKQARNMSGYCRQPVIRQGIIESDSDSFAHLRVIRSPKNVI